MLSFILINWEEENHAMQQLEMGVGKKQQIIGNSSVVYFEPIISELHPFTCGISVQIHMQFV